jgi:hypothetical protein
MATTMEGIAEDKKQVTIYVEGTPHPWLKHDEISFDQVAIWVYPDYSPTDGKAYTITYEKGDNEKPEGQLVKGSSIKVKDGMTFHVSRTGES